MSNTTTTANGTARCGKLGQRVAYACGNLGQSAFYNALSTYFVVYVTSSLFAGVDKGVATKLIGIITGLVVVIRIAEIFIDPLLGNIIDNTTTKWGRFRPWQFIASCDGHDFDRDEENPFTEKLLAETLAFLEENLKLSPAQC